MKTSEIDISDEDASKGLRRSMEAAHLDDTIPCPLCDKELYFRIYDKVDSMSDFGDE